MWDEIAGLQALERAFKEENKNTYNEMTIDPSMVAEVLTSSEAKGVFALSAALSQAQLVDAPAAATEALRTTR